jgi:hypothetical protein
MSDDMSKDNYMRALPFLRMAFRWACVWRLLAANLVFAGPGSRAWIPDLTAKADAVVVGSVRAIAVNGTISATIDVERVLKGSVSRGIPISVTWASRLYADVHDIPVDHGIFFLSHSSAGLWSLLPTANGAMAWWDTYVRTPEAATGRPQGNASALDKVLAEIVAAVEAGGRPDVDLVAIFRLNRSPVLAAAFRRFETASDVRLKGLALAALLSVGDTSAITTVQQSSIALASTQLWPEIVREIEQYYVSTDPSAIHALGTLAVDPKTSQSLRAAAAMALARAHSKATLPYLAQLLDDSDSLVRARGVGGLAMFANHVPIGSHEPAAGEWIWRTEETIAHSAMDQGLISSNAAYYIGFWKSWWVANQTALSQ